MIYLGDVLMMISACRATIVRPLSRYKRQAKNSTRYRHLVEAHRCVIADDGQLMRRTDFHNDDASLDGRERLALLSLKRAAIA